MLISDHGLVGDLFFSNSDPFPFTPNDVVQPPPNTLHEIPPPPLDPFSPPLFSFDSNPPSLESEIGDLNFCGLDGFKAVKSEDSQMGVVDYNNGATAMQLQRSYSSRSFEAKPASFFQPHYDSLMDPSHFQTHPLASPENRFLATGQIRRVCSTGDLQKEGLLLEEANFKVGRYSAEERREKISKYRAKRSQRNFNKTIKYACRKTLADNRPRIRGRFARNDESCDNPKASSSCSARDEDEEDFWFEGLHEEQEDITMRASAYGGGAQFQCYGFGV
ncbi:zinc finger protein HD1 [Senna tora]|uniref:Zinc finger protein HD1 n=1 Tax=Senna tora TaxID=362788 RepID=A0A834WRZ1_9FABA|nr:zinc finger protein HD1 [Senna tora]